MVKTLHFTPKWSPGVSLMVGGVEIFLTSDLITSIVYPLHTPPELKLLMDNLDNFFLDFRVDIYISHPIPHAQDWNF